MAKSKKNRTKDDKDPARTYKLVELVGTSNQSYEDAIGNAVADASQTLKGLSWFEVAEMRGHIADGKVVEYQAKVKVAFRVIH